MSGDEGDRTPDLGVANAALSHLSYIPTRDRFHIKLIIKGQSKIYWDNFDSNVKRSLKSENREKMNEISS